MAQLKYDTFSKDNLSVSTYGAFTWDSGNEQLIGATVNVHTEGTLYSSSMNLCFSGLTLEQLDQLADGFAKVRSDVRAEARKRWPGYFGERVPPVLAPETPTEVDDA